MTVEWVELPTPSLDVAAKYRPDGLWDIVEDIGTKMIKAVNDVFRWLYDTVENHMDKLAAVLGAAIGTAGGGPVGGLFGGVGGYFFGDDLLEDWARDKISDAADKVEAMWTKLWKEIVGFARQVLGDPAELYLNAKDYNSCTTRLSEIGNDLQDLKSRVDAFWDGPAALTYTSEVDAQLRAVNRLKDYSKQLAVLSAHGAIDVLSGWLWLPLQMQRVMSQILGVIAGAFDAGNLILAEAGPIINLLRVGYDFVLDARDEVIERVKKSAKDAVTVAAERADSSGFPDGRWPTSHSPEILNTPANWTPTPVH